MKKISCVLVGLSIAISTCQTGTAQTKEKPKNAWEENQEEKSDAEVILSVIPAATAVSLKEWRGVVDGAAAAMPCESLMGFFLRTGFPPNARDDSDDAKKRREEFSYLGGDIVSPAKLAREVSRGKHRTFVKADRINGFTCDVSMDTAEGTVKFKVPEMLQGKFNYVAKQTETSWKIVEFSMPAHEFRIALQEDGTWLQQPLDDE